MKKLLLISIFALFCSCRKETRHYYKLEVETTFTNTKDTTTYRDVFWETPKVETGDERYYIQGEDALFTSKFPIKIISCRLLE